MNRPYRLEFVGIIAILLITLAVMFVLPGLASSRPTLIGGMVLLLLGLVLAIRRTIHEGEHWIPAPVEHSSTCPVPADDLATLDTSERKGRIRGLVTRSLLNAGSPPSEATEMIKTGTWTDDRLAARYLSDRPLRTSVRTKLRALARRETVNDLAERRAVAELETLRNGLPVGDHDER